MKVLSLGMPRTGTASMHAALTRLGFETYHGFRAYADAQDYDLWLPAYETKYFNSPSDKCPQVNRAFFDKVLAHYSAVTDMPPASFAPELIEAYPDAKIVLVSRNEDAWYASFENIFVKTYESTLFRIISYLDQAKAGRLCQFLVRGVAQGHFRANSAEELRNNAIKTFRQHNESIRSLLKERGEEHRLLEYDLGSGWEPLCEFLGKSVPRDQAFPRVNETAMMQEKIRVANLVGARRAAIRHKVPWLLIVVVLATLMYTPARG